jgi:hypothetical protein
VLTNTDLVRISEALKIPAANYDEPRRLLLQMETAVLNAHARDGFNKSTLVPASDRASLKKIGSAARKLSDALKLSSEGGMHTLDMAWPKSQVAPDQMLSALDALQNIAKKPLKRGRPPLPHVALRTLTGWLGAIAEKCGGHASINAAERKGRLIDAINVVRDLLPAGIVPKELPLGTLDRCKCGTTRVRKRLSESNRTKITRL